MLFYTQQLLIDSRVNWRVNVTVVLRVDLSSLKKKKLTRFFSYVPVLMKFNQSSKGEAVQWVISVLEIF